MDVTFYIADAVMKTVFSTTNLTAKGVGSNENKAYINGISNITFNAPQFQDFIEKGKQNIVEYYNSKCDFIIKEALPWLLRPLPGSDLQPDVYSGCGQGLL
jgi:hypothetical protein